MPVAAITSRRTRVRSLVAAGACLVLGIGLQLLDRTLLVDVLGGALYVGLFAFLLRACWPRLGAAVSAATAFAFATVIEVLQLTGLSQRVVEIAPPARLLLGSAFDPIDVLAYAAGAVLACLVQLVFMGDARAPSVSGDARAREDRAGS